MPRRLTPSQLRAHLRQTQARQRAAGQKFNRDLDRAVRQHNDKVRRHNSERQRRIDAHNRQVRAYNARQRANRARLRSALHRLSNLRVPAHYSSLRGSAASLSEAYGRLDRSSADPFLADLAESETANSATVLGVLVEDGSDDQILGSGIDETKVRDQLASFSAELSERWSGAIFSLNRRNPEAARHFCASAREIISGILDTAAPDGDVLTWFPGCPVTEEGRPTRRAKIGYCLERSGRYDDALASFADANITDILVLFKDLNVGAHGPAGKFSLSQLAAIRARVEGAINFMTAIAAA